MQKSDLDPQYRQHKSKLYTIASLILLFAMILIGSGFDWLNLVFDFSRITTWNYWNGVLQQCLLYGCSVMLGHVSRLQKEVLTNADFAHDIGVYRQKLAFKTQSFTQYIDGTLNPQIQLDYYKAMLERKLYRLDRHARDIDRLEYAKALEGDDLEEYNFSDKRSRRYAIKRFRLEQMMLDKNIAENCAAYGDYPRINAHSFTWSIGEKGSRGDEWKTENAAAKDMARVFIRKALDVALAGLFIGSIIADPQANEILETANGWLKLILIYLVRVVAMVWSYGTGAYEGKENFERNYILVAENRIKILDLYISWQSTTGERDTPTYRLMQYLNRQIEKERSQMEGPDAWSYMGNKNINPGGMGYGKEE